jgi:hypothetical protein
VHVFGNAKSIGEAKLHTTALMAGSMGKKGEKTVPLSTTGDKWKKTEFYLHWYYHEAIEKKAGTGLK